MTEAFKEQMNSGLGTPYHIIWLDSHICRNSEHHKLKTDFTVQLASVAAVIDRSIDPAIDRIFQHVPNYGAPITFVDKADKALDAIRQRSKFDKIIFITSGSLGRVVIPQIHEEELKVYRYYIFCGTMKDHVDWIMEYAQQGIDIVPQDFELDLLIRLARDMCREFIDEGKKLLNTGYAWMALKYFECALELGDKAYNLDLGKDLLHKHIPSMEHRRLLLGVDGLIAQAKQIAAC